MYVTQNHGLPQTYSCTEQVIPAIYTVSDQEKTLNIWFLPPPARVPNLTSSANKIVNFFWPMNLAPNSQLFLDPPEPPFGGPKYGLFFAQIVNSAWRPFLTNVSRKVDYLGLRTALKMGPQKELII